MSTRPGTCFAAAVTSDRPTEAERHLAALERLERVIATFASRRIEAQATPPSGAEFRVGLPALLRSAAGSVQPSSAR